MIAAVVAIAENNVIGKDNQLAWHLPADLKHFKNCTLGHPMVMGRKTFDSIGKALPGRTTIIVTRDKNYQAPENCLVAHSVEEALELGKKLDPEQVSVIGGEQIFVQTLPQTDRIYLTRVHHSFDGDTFFPELNMQDWTETSREHHQPDEKNPYPYTFITLDRKRK